MSADAGTPPAGTPPASGTPTPTGTGVTTQVPFGQTPPATPPAFDLKTVIPAEFKDKPYLSDVDNAEKLFKKLDGAMTLLGKRPAGIPEANAPKEKWDEFWKAAGRPEKAEDYEFEKVEGLNYSDDFLGAVKGLMLNVGVPKEMAKNLQKGFDALQLEAMKKHKEMEAAEDAKFDTLVKPHMGDDTDKALKASQALIKSVLPADLAPHFDKLTPAQAAIMAVVVNKLAEKFIAPDKLPSGDGGGSAQGENVEALRAEARKLMATTEFNRPDHPENANVRAKVDALYARIGAMQNKK